MGSGGVPNELGTSLFAEASALKMRQIVHGNRRPASSLTRRNLSSRPEFPKGLSPSVGESRVASPRYVLAQSLQYPPVRRMLLIGQQNDRRPKIPLRLGSIRNAWTMLSDDVFNRVGRDPTRGEDAIPIRGKQDLALTVKHPIVHLPRPRGREPPPEVSNLQGTVR